MKLATLINDGRFDPAVVIGEDLLNIPAATSILPTCGQLPSSIKELIARNDSSMELLKTVVDAVASDGAIAARLRDRGTLRPCLGAQLAPPVLDGAIIISAAMNYHSHLKEMGDVAPPTKPTAFLKAHSAVTGSGQPIILPPGHDQMIDWEGEFCAVVGRAGRNIPREKALDYVFGFTLMNDVSAREFVGPFMASTEKFGAILTWERNVLGKNFPTFCPLGPYIATKDEFADPSHYHIETLLNGEVVQSASSKDLVFTVAELVSYYSGFYGLSPGDIISTGSPAGVGMMMKPPRFLRKGDTIEVAVKEIGTLSNFISAYRTAA